ncbi:hypothetical protein [Tautonia sociabilis]|uniref:DUF997 family protein n=1 Tax=Tautonia sociabilis TaxID=2080755 RepID=A0A432MRZ7_9BACT|nr:hypothetical protein [Tautonia sociabilis]RUL89767.1 hypothetical protein TsocGM_00970 [Tautonia sociabilis]
MADPDDDPVYLDSRREALVILLAWFACLVWTVGFCYLHGYSRHDRVPGEVSALLPPLDRFDRAPDSLTMPLGLGIPDWALWGVVVPWVLCIGFSAWFCFAFMKDDPEAADQGEDEHVVDPAREQ